LLILFWDALHATAWICLVALSASIAGLGYLTEHRRRNLRALLTLVAQKFSAGSRADERAQTSMPATVTPANARTRQTTLGNVQRDDLTTRTP
jgi:hypothetical protein